MNNLKKYLLIFACPFFACSTNKLSQVQQEVDNVYVSKARAKEVEVYVANTQSDLPSKSSRDFKTEEEVFGDEIDRNRYSDFSFDDVSFSSRIYRFNYNNPWRNYYDPFFDFRFDPFLYNDFYLDNYYFRNSSWWSINIYSGPSFYWNNPYRRPWILSPYSRYRWGNYWGLYSFYNPVSYPPLYGWYDGRFDNPVNPRVLRPRPRGAADNIGNGNWNNGKTFPSRAERYPASTGPGSANGRSSGARPTRSQDNRSSSRETNSRNNGSSGSRAERYTSPSNTGSSGSNKSSETNTKPRPSRSGGR